SCTLADGTTTPPHHSRMINHAFTVGGGPDEDVATAAACLRRTVELNTGVRTDEHLVVDMAGVQDMIDLLGGVPMDLPEAMDSPEAGLHVAGGPQVFDGRTTLAFIRARKGTGNGLELGSDLARITRQQQLLGALVTTVQSQSLLRDAPMLLSVLDTASRSLSVSDGLADVTSLAGLAMGLRNLEPGRLVTTTVPVAEAPSNRNRVVWSADAAELWARIAADEPPAPPTPPTTTTPPPPATATG
ncbi:MAG TPA: LCP family protein, partial [Cellulomonas sp.]